MCDWSAAELQKKNNHEEMYLWSENYISFSLMLIIFFTHPQKLNKFYEFNLIKSFISRYIGLCTCLYIIYVRYWRNIIFLVSKWLCFVVAFPFIHLWQWRKHENMRWCALITKERKMGKFDTKRNHTTFVSFTNFKLLMLLYSSSFFLVSMPDDVWKLFVW